MIEVGAERVVQAADQVGDDIERNRVQAGERLVVHSPAWVVHDSAGERDAARPSAGELASA